MTAAITGKTGYVQDTEHVIQCLASRKKVGLRLPPQGKDQYTQIGKRANTTTVFANGGGSEQIAH